MKSLRIRRQLMRPRFDGPACQQRIDEIAELLKYTGMAVSVYTAPFATILSLTAWRRRISLVVDINRQCWTPQWISDSSYSKFSSGDSRYIVLCNVQPIRQTPASLVLRWAGYAVRPISDLSASQPLRGFTSYGECSRSCRTSESM